MLTLYLSQRYLIFKPSHRYILPQQMDNSPFTENILTMQDGTKIMTWYAEGKKSKPAILFFHGRSRQLAAYAEPLYAYIRQEYGVLMMEYRNFGCTLGKTLQSKVFSDAAETYDWLKTQGYPKIVVYGYSYGASVAAGLTALRPVEMLILTSPFSSLKQLVKETLIPFASWLLKDKYPSDDYIRNYRNPLLILHGDADKLIPIHHGQKLYEQSASTDKTFIAVKDCHHKPIFFEHLCQPAILEWLQTR